MQQDLDKLQKVYQLFVEAPNDAVPAEMLSDLLKFAGYTVTENKLNEIMLVVPEQGLKFEQFRSICSGLEASQISRDQMEDSLRKLSQDGGEHVEVNALLNVLKPQNNPLTEDEIEEVLTLFKPNSDASAYVQYPPLYSTKILRPLQMSFDVTKSIKSTLTNNLKDTVPNIMPNKYRRIYLDSQATKPVDPRVLDAMLPYYVSIFGNPHSRTHAFGWNAEAGVEKARKQVADLINADPKEIIFTSGATESNNTAIKGIAEFLLSSNKPVHIITTQIDHKCVLDTCRRLEEKGVKVTYLPVKEDGMVDLDKLREAITPETALVSIIALNNEVGVVQPLKEIGKICRERGVKFHTDAAQAFGNIKLDVNEMNIDLLSISGHKIYGPKGVGALYVRRRPRVRILPLINGGGQERGLRSGTTPPPLVVGLGKAAEIASKEMINDNKYIDRLSKRLKDKLFSSLDNIMQNGAKENSFSGCLNISFPHVEGEGLMMNLKDIAVSSGSACTSASLEPSYVLRALGRNDDLAHSSIRFGINKFTTESEIDKAADSTIKAVNKLREMSPLYEMEKEGIDLSKIDWSA